MGIGRLLTMGAEHTIKQSQIDAARIKQAANNAASLSLAESQRIIQRSNNAASEVYAENARRIQAANNAASDAVAAGRTLMRDAGNDQARVIAAGQTQVRDASNSANKAVAEQQRKMQASFNGQAILVREAKKVLQAARNERAGVESDVARWSQSLKNKRILDEGAERTGQILNETLQGMDRAIVGGVFARIEAAQVMGATTANAAALGVGGSSIDQIKDTIQMRQALETQQQDEQLHSAVVNSYRQRGNVMADAISQLDFSSIVAEQDRTHIELEQDFSVINDNQDYSPISANIDYNPIFADRDYQSIVAQKDFTVFTADQDFTKYLDHKKMGFAQTALTVVGAAAATYFGGPMAGEAVINASMGINDAQNLDFASANKSFGAAFSQGMQGVQTYRAGASGGSSGQAWGAQFRQQGTPAAAPAPYVSNVGSVVNYGFGPSYGQSLGYRGNPSQGYGATFKY